jgi:hypothetical protein
MLQKFYKNIYFLFFLLFLSLPLLQMLIPVVKVKPLKGSFRETKIPELNGSNWFSGQFSVEFENYINDSIGFRPWMVRLHHQIEYSLFNKINTQNVLQGKNGFLYESSYIDSYNGKDYLGKIKINEKVAQIKQLQNLLSERNITLIVCLAPGKASYYPEYFPPNLVTKETDSTNYKQFATALKEQKINHIDFNRWFLNMKKTSDFQLFPKHGIHWSFYGMLKATDSLIHFVEKDRNISMPKYKYLKINHYKIPKYSDYDIAESMNLMFQLHDEPMCYPDYRIVEEQTSYKPKTLVISDSFYWSMYNVGVGKDIFSWGGFWYYNEMIYPQSFQKPLYVKDVDFKQKILENEVIIIMATESNLSNFGWGFIEKATQELIK